MLARTGGADDNVPPIHSRRMVRLINEYSANPRAASLSEVPGQGHYFEGIMDDDFMQSFIDNYTNPSAGARQTLPSFPSLFTVTTLNPSSSGPRGSVEILQLQLPYRLGRVHVTGAGGSQWTLRTENVRRFSFQADSRRIATSFVVDGESFGSVQVAPQNHYCRLDGRWRLCTDSGWVNTERSATTYGPIFQIYESRSLIVVGTEQGPTEAEKHLGIALEIANTMYLYGRSNVEVVFDVDYEEIQNPESCNLILIGGPRSNLVTLSIEQNLPGLSTKPFTLRKYIVVDSYSLNNSGVLWNLV